jgi:nicotinate-nucleotide adenylyltransferase
MGSLENGALMSRRIGVMGGTFDPVHLGHLRAAEEAVEMLRLDTLLFVPAAAPPHKVGKSILPFEHRWRMLELAVKGHPCFELSDIENRLPGKSYTVVTLRKLREEIASLGDLYFLVGMDAFLEMNTWWHFKELFELAHMAVLRRPGYHEEEIGAFLNQNISSLYSRSSADGPFQHPYLCSVYCLENTHMGISSTRIRRLAANGGSIRYLVLSEVMSYINDKKLYQL